MNKAELKKYFITDMHQGWRKSSGSRMGFKFLMDLMSFVKGGVILDAGAGHLRFKPFFEDSIYISQEHTSGISLKGMEHIVYDLVSPIDKKIPLQDNSLDAILLNSTLEHIRYPEKFFAEAIRVLKPGGRLYVYVPFFYFEHEVPYDFQRPTRFGLKRWFEDASFINIKIKPGSSCTSNITNFLPLAVVYDILQTNKNPKTLFNELLNSHNGYLKVFRKLHLFIFAGSGYLFMKLFVGIINFIINVEPYQEANMPTGWLACASKPGKYKKHIYKTKEEFLKENLNMD